MARLLFVSTSTTIGGAEKTLFELAVGLAPLGHPCAAVVSLKPEGHYASRLRDAGVRVESLAVVGAATPLSARRLAAVIGREKPDVVIALMYQAIQAARLAKSFSPQTFRLLSSPRVGYRTRSTLTLMVDRALRGRDDLLISECEASRRYLVDTLGYSPDKVRVILNGVATSAPDPAAGAALRAELGASPEDVVIGAVGRLERQKGLDVLIEAIELLKDVPLRCAIVGEGPERRRLTHAISRHGLSSRVRLLGEREASGVMNGADVICMPSRWEGLPNVLLEAMARGKAVVASAVDGIPEAAADGREALLVPPEDPVALAAALRRAARDATLRATLGAAAANTVAARFTPARMLAEYADACRSLTA